MCLEGLDDSTTNHLISTIEYCGLSGTERSLRNVKTDTQGVPVNRLDGSRGCRCGVSNLHVEIALSSEEGSIEQIEILHFATLAKQRFLRSQDDGIRYRLHLLDVEPLACGNTKPASLPRSVEGDPLMLAEMAAMLIDKRAWPPGLGHFPFNEGAIVSMAHEADFLTLLQFIGRKTKGLCLLPDLALLHASHGKQEA